MRAEIAAKATAGDRKVEAVAVAEASVEGEKGAAGSRPARGLVGADRRPARGLVGVDRVVIVVGGGGAEEASGTVGAGERRRGRVAEDEGPEGGIGAVICCRRDEMENVLDVPRSGLYTTRFGGAGTGKLNDEGGRGRTPKRGVSASIRSHGERRRAKWAGTDWEEAGPSAPP